MPDTAPGQPTATNPQLEKTPPGAPPAPPTTGKLPPAGDKSETNIKETIESILIAFILAFIFRAFIVEAFVIPTGSMATTLLGAHMRYDCNDCGYHFTVNYSGDQVDGDVQIPSFARVAVRDRNGAFTGQVVNQVFAIHCPNCGYRVPRNNADNPDTDATAPPVHFGDRILVLKYLYLMQHPARWDVVVFKNPDSPVRDHTQNYIKRLIGLPGESIMILDGDIYTAAADAQTAEDFKVARKRGVAQEALWRIVYDHDYQPVENTPLTREVTDGNGAVVRVEPKFVVPWQPTEGTGWTVAPDNRRAFTFTGDRGTLQFNTDANPTKYPLTDWTSYDVTVNQSAREGASARPPFDTFVRGGYDPVQHPMHNVSDIKLHLSYTRTDGSGPLVLQTTKLEHAFTVELHPGRAVMTMRRAGAEPVVIGEASIPDTQRPMRVELTNADYRVSLEIDGTEVLATTDAQYSPDVAWLIDTEVRNVERPKPQIRIEARDQTCRIEHLSLWRDVYYSWKTMMPIRAVNRATPWNFPSNVVRLGDDEFFVLGDNPLISGDARTWASGVELTREGLFVEPGKVPGRFLLGKAFFVYWPAGYRPFSGAPGIVPNFGKMRFIH